MQENLMGKYYPKWIGGVTPDTAPNAIPIAVRMVDNVAAINVRGAKYRSCKPVDGVFELASLEPRLEAGSTKYDVICAWFGVTPPNQDFLKLTVQPGHFEILQTFSGEVIDDISVRGSKRAVVNKPKMYPDEIDDSHLYSEGAKLVVTVNRYERNRVARNKCLEHHGYRCAACKKSLEDIYGPAMKHAVHVHHKTPLAEIGHDYEVDPVNDLIPVCPNCHTAIHYGGEVRTVEEVQELIDAARERRQ